MYSLGECTGENTEFPDNHNDLKDWNDKIRSWEMCSAPVQMQPEGSRVTFYVRSQFRGTHFLSAECDKYFFDLFGLVEFLDT